MLQGQIMRKHLLTSVSITAFLLGASATHAADFEPPASPILSNTYISIFGGYTVAPDAGFTLESYTYDTSFKDGFTVGGAYGGYLTPSLRGEVELSYQRYSTDLYTYYDGDAANQAGGYVSSVNVLLNVWKDIDVGAAFTPYVGAGLGVGVGKMSIEWNDDGSDPDSLGNRPGLATQLGAGVRMAVSDQVMIDVGYRFRSLFDIVAVSEDYTKANYFNHTFQAGVTYAMGDGFAQPVADLEPFGSSAYFTAFGGVAIPESSGIVEDTFTYELNNKTGFTVGAAAGTSVAPGLRAELEASYTKYSHNNYTLYPGYGDDSFGNTGLFMVMANVWKDIPLGAFAPYVGAGVGVGVASSYGETEGEFDDTRIGLGLQFGGGVRYAMSDSWLVDVGYRAKGVLGTTLQGANGDFHHTGSFLTHTAQVGVTYGGGMYAAPAAYSDSGNYVSVFGGVVLPMDVGLVYDSYVYDTHFKTGFTVGAAVGTQILETVRGELEVTYASSDTCGARDANSEDKCKEDWGGQFSSVTVMTNAWKDFEFGMFTPYVGGGVGLAIVMPEIPDWGDTTLAMAGQVGTGIRFAATDNLTIDAGYRFKGIIDPVVTGFCCGDDYHAIGTFYSHNITAGLSWGF